MSEIHAYPLCWPAGWPRSPAATRKRANFNSRKDTGASYRSKRQLTVSDGLDRVRSELSRMGIPSDQVIVSSDMPLRQDGCPYSGKKEPNDPGVAVYWRDSAEQAHLCIAIDQYNRLTDNLAAIAGTLKAMRDIDRWGGASILERAFQGFIALPEKVSTGWWVVLEVEQEADYETARNAFHRLRARSHPDRPGGNADRFQAVIEAWKQACAAHQDESWVGRSVLR